MGARGPPPSPFMAVVVALLLLASASAAAADNIQPLSTLKMQAALVAMDSAAVIHVSPAVLGKNVSNKKTVVIVTC
jgi:acid phosphatase type 7